MTRAHAHCLPINAATVSNTLPPLDQIIFELISLNEPPRTAFEASILSKSLADFFQVAGATPSKFLSEDDTQVPQNNAPKFPKHTVAPTASKLPRRDNDSSWRHFHRNRDVVTCYLRQALLLIQPRSSSRSLDYLLRLQNLKFRQTTHIAGRL